ncbi:MAG: MFS transporter [Dehalococcoidia bacterium]|nr:MFS transporter [Dehalococcoidia bacterium]
MVEPQTAERRAVSYGRRILGPWRSSNFRWYWTSSSTQALSQGMQFLVLGWLVLEVTGSSTQFGLVLFLYGVPNVGLLMVGGVIADRIDRKRLLMVIQIAVGAAISALAVLSLTDVIAVWHIYLAAVLLGSLQALNQPARVAMVADLVDQRTLLDAVAHFNAAVHIGRIVGPPLVGAVIDHVSISAALLVNASCYVVSVLCVSRIRPGAPSVRPASDPILRNFTDGVVQIWRSPVLLTVLVLACSWGGFGMSHLAIIPAFAKEHLGSGAYGAGLLLLANAVGSLIGNLSITFMHRAWLYRWLLACLVSFAAFLTLFAWSHWFWASWALFLVVGALSLGTVWPLATTILQLTAPAEIRGRVMGVLHFTPGFHYLGALPLAAASGWVGWPSAIGISAGLCLLVTIWFGVARAAGRRLAVTPAV